MEVLKVTAERSGFTCDSTESPWGSEFYLKAGKMMKDEWVETLQSHPLPGLVEIGKPVEVRESSVMIGQLWSETPT